MATLYGTTSNDSIATGTTGADTITTGAGHDVVQGSGGNDVISLGYKSSFSYLRHGFTDFDTLDYLGTWSHLLLANDASMHIVADLEAGTVTKYNGASVLGQDTVSGVDAVAGTNASDTLAGRNHWQYEEFRGNGGNDTINGRGSEDAANYSASSTAGVTVNMAAGTVSGTDALVGSDTLREIENVIGTSLADTYNAVGYGGSSANRNSFGSNWNVFNPLGGDDTVRGNGETILNLGSAAGTLNVNLALLTTSSVISTTAIGFTAVTGASGYAVGTLSVSGVNSVLGGQYNDVLSGGGKVNTLGAAAQNTVSGDTSFEWFRGGGGNDVIRGYSGLDRADYRSSTSMTEGIVVNLAAGRVTGDLVVGVDTLRGIESIRGTYLDDVYDARGFTVSSATAPSTNNGDVISSAPVGETLASNAFNEFIASGGNDVVTGNGATRVSLDYHVEKQAGVSARVVFSSATAGHADLGLTDGGLGQVDFTGTVAVRGGTGHDDLSGNVGYQQLQGGYGNDTLRGGDGNDILYGHHGVDKAALNLSSTFSDNDSLDGGAGNDLLRGDFGHDIMQGGTGADTMEGGTGNDAYYVDNSGDVVTEIAGGGSDTVYSSLANYTLGTQVEAGRINVATAANLTGNTLANTLVGSTGANRLTGGAGKDALTGGGGNDVFDYNLATETGTTSTSWDVITDFNAGDRIDLSGIDADTGTLEDDAFSGILVTTLTGAGQLRYDAAARVLYGSTDADAAAEFAIELTGVASLSASAFVL
jgi:Ca2+-binding RTX toxin-like protein